MGPAEFGLYTPGDALPFDASIAEAARGGIGAGKVDECIGGGRYPVAAPAGGTAEAG